MFNLNGGLPHGEELVRLWTIAASAHSGGDKVLEGAGERAYPC